MANTIKGLLSYFLGFAIICSLTVSSPSFAYEKEIKSISLTIAQNITKSGKKSVAVVDFTGLQGNVTELGRFLAEELSVELVTIARGFSVIDRTHLKSILAEHKLSISGIADPEAVKKLGQIAGVDAIITGSVTPLGNCIRVTTKVIATDTANVIGASKADIAKTKAIEELLARGIGGSAYEGAFSSPTSASQSKNIEAKVLDFIFRVSGCQRKGEGQVTCHVVVINKGIEVDSITIGGVGGSFTPRYNTCTIPPSLLTDNLGNQYIAAKVQFGAQTKQEYVSRLISPDIPTSATLIFKDVSPQAQFVHLQLTIEPGSSCKDFFPAFRNIPLSR